MRTLPFRLGRYTLFDHIAKGGMADIYLARTQTELGGARLVVIKELLAELSGDARFSEMLIDEAKLAAQLSHANIARVEDLGRHEERLYIAMEYVEGLDLRELLKQCSKRKIPLPMDFRLYVVREMLRALDYAHHYRLEDAVGIIHRDVSPSNVLLSFDGEVKLCDFGIASALSVELVPTETIEGKAGYMSPEHARGEMVDERSDLFAAGIVLWELLSGRKMYKATPETPLIHQAQRGQAPPLRSLELPEADALQAIVRRALAERPDDRYQSAGELFEELYGYCIRTRQMASALRFGGWLSEHFSAEKLQRRRARERAIAALELGPPVVMRRIASTPPTASASEVAPPPMSPASSSRPPMLSSRPPLAHPSLSSKPPPFGGEPPPVAERSATIAEDPAAPSSRPSPAPRSSPPSSREPPSSAPATGPNMRIVLIAFALTFALMCLLAWLGVIRF